MEKLLVVLNDVQKYVDNVVDGSAAPMAEYGMKIADAIGIYVLIFIFIYMFVCVNVDVCIYRYVCVYVYMYV
jgi:hypothetical protein